MTPPDEDDRELGSADAEAGPPPGLTVVGIGASSGGLAALKSFFREVPPDSGLAWVVVVHLSPDHESHLAELLQPHIRMPVQQVTENTKLETDHVYLIPPGRNLSAVDTHLRLEELERRRRERAPIDHFLRTLASTHDGSSIGVILTGTGSDGTLGIEEIKGRNGLVIVQDPADAEYDGMPQSALSTGLADLVLPLVEIPDAILRFARTDPDLRVPTDEEEVREEEGKLLPKVFAQIRARTGRDFARYKRSTLLRRIHRRMQLRQVIQLEDYVELLRDEPTEVRALAEDLLITVTNFFRDEAVFDKLEAEVIPQLFEGRTATDTLRVWSVGCATGEEAYSLAMLLLEEVGRREARGEAVPRLQIFASDLHERSLERAREGFYPGDIDTDVSQERLQRFFHPADGGYRIRKEVREMVVFAPHNLLRDPPFSRLDLISCRNLLIYLQREVQREVIDLFHYALRPEGVLVLGSSETLDSAELFRVEDKRLCIYRKRNVPAPEPRLPVFPLTRARLLEGVAGGALAVEPMGYGSLHQRMVETYAPPSLLLSPDDKVVHLSEHVGRYLVHPGGEITSNIFRLVRPELRVELRAAVHGARGGEGPIHTKPVRVLFEGQMATVAMDVRPAMEPEQEGFVLVVFDERPVAGAGVDSSAGRQKRGEVEAGIDRAAQELRGVVEEMDGAPEATTSDSVGERLRRALAALEAATGERDGLDRERLGDLRAELELTQQRLQAMVEEYETSQEEMKASNEELQSANEELRSTLEELETSREELQSMNEELQTVNQENRHKVEEFAQLSGDLQNLLAATEIATLFLDRELRILRFTPKLGELFNVRPADRGRPISDLTHRLEYPELQEDARRVLDRLIPIEREVADEGGEWYLARMNPYRSADDRIEGVVITFVVITAMKRIEATLREREERYRELVDAKAGVQVGEGGDSDRPRGRPADGR